MNEMNTNGDVERARMEEGNTVSSLVSIITLGVTSLCELGMLAARDGGNLVTILNTSWKGVITLLQIDKHTLASKVDVGEIILKLITLIKESLRLAAEAWSCSVKETISATEARRVFLHVKFYLINDVKLVALFPSQSSMVFKEITLCILMISALKSVMRYSSELEEDAKLAITRKLQWLLDILTDEEVYSSVLSSQLPMADGSGKTIVWESMFSALLLSLKALMITLSSSPAWEELETFSLTAPDL
ncbi:hypothetical protein F2Q70_00019381 [Brassica cretica]|nr:hypothetical protein F2Q70_00019381 [Brassica cretica]KAF3610847.1 hypothetical protein DY000_02044380 [Brassica cretica]